MKKATVMSVQIEPILGDKKTNYEKISKLVEQKAPNNLDLIVMSEFFSTGINHDVFTSTAEEENNSPTLEYFSKLAQQYKTYIVCGSIIIKENQNFYNTSFLIDRSGKIIAKYRKINLFDSFGGTEHEVISRGEDIVVVNTDFGKLGLAICFDIRYPQHFLKLLQKGAEIIALPAAWGMPNELEKEWRNDWILLNKSRSFDSFAYLVSADISGRINPEIVSCGHSMIVAPNNNIIAEAGNEDEAIVATLDPIMIENLRNNFNMKHFLAN
ncbi:MAG: hypothetical protein PHV37_03825 [Candidatus Gastranaerophilales bacterium]|nr:hypothetical protein [Candidatus Gastranaerophilales bacterium]